MVGGTGGSLQLVQDQILSVGTEDVQEEELSVGQILFRATCDVGGSYLAVYNNITAYSVILRGGLVL